jgi:putative DNA primase/helicase
VNDLTGGDTLTGRAPHAMAAICFRPSHRLVIVGNHKPAIADTSSGMWRRRRAFQGFALSNRYFRRP